MSKGVDLVDEDDAATPNLGSLASGTDHEVDTQGVDSQQHSCEGAAVGDVDGDMKRRSDSLRQHRFPGSWWTNHQNAALALAPSLDEEPAVFDQPEDAAHLSDR